MTIREAAGEQPHHAEVHLHTEHRIAPVDARIFGGFLEHMGRAVYGGVFDPGNPLSDERGYRTDVMEVLRSLRMPMIRYPGGNFVSNHDWRHAVGPRDQRPRRPDFAWRSIETHQFGTDEFMEWCDALGTAPMMAVNLGTGTAADAAALLEYCNLPGGTSYADQRIANGVARPYGVKLWCLGNEMDGPWQAGHVPATTYAERALAASQLMKRLDPTIATIACGTSARMLPSYMEWDRTVLEQCWESIDFISAHRYSRNDRDDTKSFLAEGVVIDEVLDDYRGVLAYVKARKRSRHQCPRLLRRVERLVPGDRERWWLGGSPATIGRDLQRRGRAGVRAVSPLVRAQRRHRAARMPRADRERHRACAHATRWVCWCRPSSGRSSCCVMRCRARRSAQPCARPRSPPAAATCR